MSAKAAGGGGGGDNSADSADDNAASPAVEGTVRQRRETQTDLFDELPKQTGKGVLPSCRYATGRVVCLLWCKRAAGVHLKWCRVCAVREPCFLATKLWSSSVSLRKPCCVVDGGVYVSAVSCGGEEPCFLASDGAVCYRLGLLPTVVFARCMPCCMRGCGVRPLHAWLHAWLCCVMQR